MNILTKCKLIVKEKKFIGPLKDSSALHPLILLPPEECTEDFKNMAYAMGYTFQEVMST